MACLLFFQRAYRVRKPLVSWHWHERTEWVGFGILFALHETFSITSLSSNPVFLLAYFSPRISLDICLAVYICFTLFVHFSWMRVGLVIHLVSEGDPFTDCRRGDFGAVHGLGNTRRAFSKSTDLVHLFWNNMVSPGLFFPYSHRFLNLLSRMVRHGRNDNGILLRNRCRLFATWLTLFLSRERDILLTHQCLINRNR